MLARPADPEPAVLAHPPDHLAEDGPAHLLPLGVERGPQLGREQLAVVAADLLAQSLLLGRELEVHRASVPRRHAAAAGGGPGRGAGEETRTCSRGAQPSPRAHGDRHFLLVRGRGSRTSGGRSAPRRGVRVPMLVLAIGLIATPALALSISEYGGNGAPTFDGEDATAVAASMDASNTALAVGGRGGSPGVASTSGGDAHATAETQASGIGVAWAKATGGVGGDGLVDLTAGPGGDAWASAVTENTSVQSASVTAEARGGDGGPMVASAYPGTYGPGGDGGGASLGRVYGTSASGGDVTVEATAAGGNGGTAGPEKAAGAGAPVALVDAVDGDTTGHLILRQKAVGGSSGDGIGPLAGSAESHLTRAKSASSLEARLGGNRRGTHRALHPRDTAWRLGCRCQRERDGKQRRGIGRGSRRRPGRQRNPVFDRRVHSVRGWRRDRERLGDDARRRSLDLDGQVSSRPARQWVPPHPPVRRLRWYRRADG